MEDISNNTDTVRLVVPDLFNNMMTVHSPFVTIGGMDWLVAWEDSYLAVYTNDCCDLSADWSAISTISYAVLAQHDGQTLHSREVAMKFNADKIYWSISRDEVLNPVKDFLDSGGSVTLEATVTVKKVVKERPTPKRDFSSPVPDITDVALVVGGKRLFVGKQHLSTFSPVFHKLFNGKFAEKEKSEIVLDDINVDEFIELLNILYAPHTALTKWNAKAVLKLADRFAVQFVLHSCVNFLSGPDSHEIELAEKLFMLDRYYNAGIQDFCLLTIKTADEGKAIMDSYEYEGFSDKAKIALLERIARLG